MAISDVDSDGDDDSGGQGEPTGVRHWLLLQVNRWVLTAAILASVFVILVGASQLGLTPFRRIVANQEGIEYLFTVFIGAIITGVTLVVTINQLVLSQELGAIGDQRSRMQESMAFQKDVETVIKEEQTPPEPSAFLWELVDGAHELANEFDATVRDERDEALREAVRVYVDDLENNAETVKNNLDGAQFGTFEVIWHALNFNYSRKIYDARKLRIEHGESLSEEANEDLDELIEALELFGPAREHFKTLYFQWELINLSRALLYIAVPVLALLGVMIMYVDASALPGTTLGVDNLVWLASAGFVVGIAPFVVFISFILRIATIAKRTLAMGPFILRESQRDSDLG